MEDARQSGLPANRDVEGRTPSNKDNGRENSAKGSQMPATGIFFLNTLVSLKLERRQQTGKIKKS